MYVIMCNRYFTSMRQINIYKYIRNFYLLGLRPFILLLLFIDTF